MARRLIGRIIDGQYVNLEGTDQEAGPKALPKYGEGADYFKGVRPSELKNLDNRQLFQASNRLYTTLEEGRGTKEELSNAHSAYDATIREARARRATLHD
jgi:hypothetical protein